MYVFWSVNRGLIFLIGLRLLGSIKMNINTWNYWSRDPDRTSLSEYPTEYCIPRNKKSDEEEEEEEETMKVLWFYKSLWYFKIVDT